MHIFEQYPGETTDAFFWRVWNAYRELRVIRVTWSIQRGHMVAHILPRNRWWWVYRLQSRFWLWKARRWANTLPPT